MATLKQWWTRIASSPRFGGYFAAMVIVFLLALAASLLFATQLEGLRSTPAERLERGWSYVQNDEPRPLGKLSGDFSAPGGVITVRHALSAEMDADDVLAVHVNYATLRAWADDELVYTSPEGLSRLPSSTWAFIPMSALADAQTLSLEFTNTMGTDTLRMDAPYLDSPGAIHHTLFIENLGVLMFSFISFLLTLGLLICALMLYRWHGIAYRQLVMLAVFVALSGIWIFLDSKFFALFGVNLALMYYLSYAAFFLLPAPYLLYIRSITSEGRRLLTALVWAIFANAVISFILRMAGLITFSVPLMICHGLLLISILCSTWAVCRSRAWRAGSQMRFTFFGMIFIYICVVVSLVLFYLRVFVATSAAPLYIVGLSVLLLCMAADALAIFGRFWRQRDIAERYRRLAMEDSMTGMNNRNAFQLHWSAMLEQPPEALAIIVFDVDNLKQINDQLGHQSGDSAISAAAQQIRSIFEGVGSCYRTGGDEFEVLLEGRQIEHIPALLTRFSKELDAGWDHSLPSDGVSYGWAAATFGDDNPLTEVALIRLRAEADESLYRLKQARKSAEMEPIA